MDTTKLTELVTRWQGGEKQLGDEIMIALQPLVARIIQQLPAARFLDAEDAEQECLLACFEALVRYDASKSSPQTFFAHRIKGCLLDLSRKDSLRGYSNRGGDTDSPTECSLSYAEHVPSDEDHEAAIDFEDWIESLPERFQTIARMRFVHDCSLEEIGEVIGLSRQRTSELQDELIDLLRRQHSVASVAKPPRCATVDSQCRSCKSSQAEELNQTEQNHHGMYQGCPYTHIIRTWLRCECGQLRIARRYDSREKNKTRPA